MLPSLHDVYFCQMERTEELSNRMYDRNKPSQQLQTSYFYRPASTRFVKFPMFDERKKATVNKAIMTEYDVGTIFNPGTSAPYVGYSKNVDVENSLLNINFPMQRAAQAHHIPSSMSDMYEKEPELEINKFKSERPYLDAEEKFSLCNPNQENIGNQLFANHTRQQTKDLFSNLIKH